jgi:fibronectin-binding autotransporter adhesin
MKNPSPSLRAEENSECKIQNSKFFPAFILFFALALVAAPAAHAADTTTSAWLGSMDTVWGTNTNWTSSVLPSTTVSALFDSTFVGANQPVLGAPGTAQGIYLANGVTQDVTITGLTSARILNITGNATLGGQANAGIMLDDTTSTNNNLTIGNLVTTTLANNTGFYVNNAGTLTLNGNGTLNLNAKVLTLGGGNASGNINISQGISGSTGAIIVDTSGTVTLGATNTFTGGITLNSGKLNLNVAGAVGGAGTTLTINGGTVDQSVAAVTLTSRAITIGGNFAYGGTNTSFNMGAGAITNAGDRTITLNGSGRTLTMGGLMTNTKGSAQTTTINGAGNIFSLGSYDLGTFTNAINGTGNTTITGVVSNGGLTYNGTGTLSLSGVNTFAGGFNLSNGTLVVGVSSVNTSGVIASGPVGTGTFQVGTSSQAVTINGVSSTTRTISNNVSFNNDVTFDKVTTAARIAFDVFTGLTTPGTITLTRTNTINTVGLAASGSTVDLIGAITGNTFGITKIGTGTLNIGGSSAATDNQANTYNGLTAVSGGIMNLNKVAGTNAIAGNVQIDTAGTLALTTSEQINDASTVTVNSGGAFSLGSKTETIGNLVVGSGFAGNAVTGSTTGTLIIAGSGSTTINSGGVTVPNLTTGTGDLTLGDGATVSSATTLNGNVAYNGTTTGATLGATTLNGTRTFTIADGAAATDLTVTGAVSNGTGTGAITKAGSGALALSGTNTYTGGTTISAGTLKVGSGTALGASGSAVSVASGAVLDLNGSTITNTNALSLNGTGIGGTGGLINSSNNIAGYAGAITLASDSTIGSTGTGNTTTISGAITSTGTANLTLKAGGTQALTLSTGGVNNTGNITNSGSGSGTVALNGIIGTNVSNVIQNSPTSMLTLGGNNTAWIGGIQINSGTVSTSGSFLSTGTKTITLGSATGGDVMLVWGSSYASPANAINVVAGTGNRTLRLTQGGSVTLSGNISLNKDLFVDTGTANNGFTLNGIITGSNKITFTNSVAGTGTTSMAGNQTTFTGVLEISNGATLSAANAPSGLVTNGTVNIKSGGNFIYTQGASIAGLNGEAGAYATVGGQSKLLTLTGSGAYNFAGIIRDGTAAAQLTMNGTGTQTLSGNNTYTGATTVNAGTLNLTGSLTGSSVTVNGATANFIQSSTSVIAGNAAFTLTNGNATLSAANTYTGNTSIATGKTLVANNVSALGNYLSTSVKLTGAATLDLATDTSINAYNIVGENSGGSVYTIIADRLTPGAGVTHTLGTLSMGQSTLNITAGTNVTSGPTAVAFGNVALTNGGGTSVTFNPTTASVSMVNVNMVSTANNQTLVLDGTATGNTISGVISNFGAGSGYNSLGLIKSNTSTWTLSGNNSYTGNTAINGGTLNIAASLGFGGLQTSATGTTTVAAGATLELGGSTNVNEPISISGTGIGGNGALVNNSGTAASIGSGIAGLAVAATGSGSGYSAAPAVLISGTGSGAAATASLGVTAASFTLTSGGSLWVVGDKFTLDGGGNGASFTVASISSGAIATYTLTTAGTGYTTAPTTLTKLTGNGTGATITGNAGNFTVGGLKMTDAGSGYTGTPTFTFGGSPATVTPTLSSVTLAADSSIGGTGDLTINAVVSGSKALTKVGSGTLTLTGANTYTGNTTISGGALQFANQTSLYTGNATSWTAAKIKVASGGTLALNVGGASEFTTGNVTTLLNNLGGTNGNATAGFAGGSKIAFDTTGGNFTVANNIADSTGTGGGAIGVTKRGSNTLTLTGANTYTGSTFVTSGTLLVNGSVGGGGISVQTGATLGGNITAGGTTSIQSGGILSVGNSPGTGIFSTLNLAGTTVMEFTANPSRGSAGIEFDTIGVSSVLSYGGDLKLTFAGTVANDNVNPFTLFTGLATKSNDFANVYIYAGATPVGSLGNTGGVWTGQANLGYGDGQQSFTFTQANGGLIVAAVPEPATWALLAFSLTTVMVLRRRRR